MEHQPAKQREINDLMLIEIVCRYTYAAENTTSDVTETYLELPLPFYKHAMNVRDSINLFCAEDQTDEYVFSSFG